MYIIAIAIDTMRWACNIYISLSLYINVYIYIYIYL